MNLQDIPKGTFSNAVPNFPMINFVRRDSLVHNCAVHCNAISVELVPLDLLQPSLACSTIQLHSVPYIHKTLYHRTIGSFLKKKIGKSLFLWIVVYQLLHQSLSCQFFLSKLFSSNFVAFELQWMVVEEKVGELVGGRWVPGVMFVKTLWQNPQPRILTCTPYPACILTLKLLLINYY